MVHNVIKSADEVNKQMINDLFDYLKDYGVDGLSEILEEIKINWDSGFYAEFLQAFSSREKYGVSRYFTYSELSNNRLMSLAEQNLPRSTRDVGLTYVEKFRPMYPFMETIYYLSVDRPLNWEDFLNIYFGGLDARLIYGLDNFDGIGEIPQPNAMFFRKLGKLQINAKAMEINFKISRLMEYLGKDMLGMWFDDFSINYCPLEEAFISFLAACCAMNEGNEHIEPEDIVKAYKIFFKLIQYDISIYQSPKNLIENIPEFSGYLVCEGCYGYYGLHPEESPEDFLNCECGGDLQFRKTLNDNIIVR